MWYVFLWLNLCSFTVFCQRGYIPHHSYFIESLLYPRQGIDSSFRDLSKPIIPNACRLTKYSKPYKKLRGPEVPPYIQYQNSLPKRNFRTSMCFPVNNRNHLPRRNKKRQDIHFKESPFSNTRESYVLYKNLPPIRINNPINNFYTTTDPSEFEMIENDALCFENNENKVKNIEKNPENSYINKAKNYRLPIGDKAINLVLPPPIIINNLGLWVSTESTSKDTGTIAYNIKQQIINSLNLPKNLNQGNDLTRSQGHIEIHSDSNNKKINFRNNINPSFNTNYTIDQKCINECGVFLKDNNATNTSEDYMNKYEYHTVSTDNISDNTIKNLHSFIEELNAGDPICFKINNTQLVCYLTDEDSSSSSDISIERTTSSNEDILDQLHTFNKLIAELNSKISLQHTSPTQEILFDENIDNLYVNDIEKTNQFTEELKNYTEKVNENNNLSKKPKCSFNQNNKPNIKDHKLYQFFNPYKRYLLGLSRFLTHIDPKFYQKRRKILNSTNINTSIRNKRTSPWNICENKRKIKREFVSSQEDGSKFRSRRRKPKNGNINSYKRITFPKLIKRTTDMETIPKTTIKAYITQTNTTTPSENVRTQEIYSKNRVFISSNNERSTLDNITSIPGTSTQTNSVTSHTPKENERTRKQTVKTETSTARLVPDTGNRNPKKLKCEGINKVDCICCMASAVADLNSIATKEANMAAIPGKISSYECWDYRPLNASYRLSSDLKPRLITKKSKELVVDEKTGPKEIMKDTFMDLMTRGIPNQGLDFYIFPSTSVTIPCFTNDEKQLSPNTADSAKYNWCHGDNKPITEGRVREDVEHKGLLEMSDATAEDTDTYKCTVSYMDPDTDQKVTETFIHSLFVVQLPKLVLHTSLHYKGKVKCDQETLEMFELYLPQQIEELVCDCKDKKACHVEIYNPLCRGKTFKIKRKNSRGVWRLDKSSPLIQDETSEAESVNMEMSLNYQVDVSDVSEIIDAAVNKTHCNPFCQLKILLKLVEMIRESLVISLSHPVNSGTGVSFQPDARTMDVKMVISCEGGLKLYQGFCIPCPLHTFSEEGSTECTACPFGFHQPRMGSKKCEKCKHPLQPGCYNLSSSGSIPWTIIIWLIITILIIAGSIIICTKFWKKRKWPRRKKRIPTDSSRRSNFQKTKSKQSKVEYFSDTSSEAPSLPPEDFTE